MSKPSDEEINTALKMAIQMREKEMDPFFLAKTLLSHNYRIGYLEKVLKAADRYLSMGMAERQRTELVKLIEKTKDAEFHTAQKEQENMGLR
ncbi:MAG: hypothetical protein OEY06_06625 [Gammaproteobacteria bacterium]|nr:hypothetical protein [Gammaproteobacteria bacterium]